MVFQVINKFILYYYRGNCVLVGSLGQPTQSLAQLALYIAGYTEQQCLEDTCDYRQFTDALKGVFRQAGLEGTQVGLILKVCMYIIILCGSIDTKL